MIRGEEIRGLPQRQVVVFARNLQPFIAQLNRCLDGPDGQQLARERDALRDHVTRARLQVVSNAELTQKAQAAAAEAHLTLR